MYVYVCIYIYTHIHTHIVIVIVISSSSSSSSSSRSSNRLIWRSCHDVTRRRLRANDVTIFTSAYGLRATYTKYEEQDLIATFYHLEGR